MWLEARAAAIESLIVSKILAMISNGESIFRQLDVICDRRPHGCEERAFVNHLTYFAFSTGLTILLFIIMCLLNSAAIA